MFCGNEYVADLPDVCHICADDRQFIPPGGQRWTLLSDVRGGVTAAELEPGLFELTVDPQVGIGQKTYVAATSDGCNILWEPPGFVGPALLDWLADHGGVGAIAASHPHLVGAAVSISHEFGRVPVWYNASDRRWVTRPDPVVAFWTDRQEIADGITLVQCGGHFPGSAVAHLRDAADGRGALLTGDTIMAVPHTQMVSFMRSYPNLIPLPPRLVRQIADQVGTLEFDRLYAAFGSPIEHDAARIVEESARRYIGWVTDTITDPDDPYTPGRTGQASG